MKSFKTLLLACMLIPSLSAIDFDITPFSKFIETHKDEAINLVKATGAVSAAGLLLEYAIKKIGYNTSYSYLDLFSYKTKCFLEKGILLQNNILFSKK